MQQPQGGAALVDQLIPRSTAALTNAVVDFVLIVGFAALTGLSAKVAVYLNPAVPITGQTFAVLMTGAVLGSKRGGASMLVYLATGIAGVPRLRSRRGDRARECRVPESDIPWRRSSSDGSSNRVGAGIP